MGAEPRGGRGIRGARCRWQTRPSVLLLVGSLMRRAERFGSPQGSLLFVLKRTERCPFQVIRTTDREGANNAARYSDIRVIGQHEIYGAYERGRFEKTTCRVRVIDAQENKDGGMLILVAGRLKHADEPREREFCQTVFLARQKPPRTVRSSGLSVFLRGCVFLLSKRNDTVVYAVSVLLEEILSRCLALPAWVVPVEAGAAS